MATQEVLEQLSNMPDSAAHPWAAAGVAAVTAAVIAMQHRKFNDTHEQIAAAFPNPALLERAVSDVHGNSAGLQQEQRRRRLLPSTLALAGAGMAAAGLLGGPQYESLDANHDAQVAVVIDSSSSMTKTNDLGIEGSRYAASLVALERIDYQGNLAIVESAESSALRLPMGSEWRRQLPQLEKPAIDPNGGDILSGVREAASVLPLHPTPENPDYRDGAVVIISDGTVNATEEQMREVAAAVMEDGIDVKVIVPGTAEATYSDGGSEPIQAGANPSMYQAFGSENVIHAEDAESVIDSVGDVMHEVGSVRKGHDWDVPLYVGGALLLYGLGLNSKQRSTRIV